VYLDSVLLALSRTRVGCFIGDIYVGVLAYADDATLIAPTSIAVRCMLHVCEEFSREFCVTFNAAKSACVVVSTKPERYSESMEFSINGKKIVFSDEYVHLGHIITKNMDDQKEIIYQKETLCVVNK